MTYNQRTLIACAKRLAHVLSRDPKAKWQVVWRYREGFRLQIEGEQHEPTGWITHGNVLTIGDKIELEWDSTPERSERIAAEALTYTLQYRPQDLDEDSLHFLAGQTDYPQIALQAQDLLREQALKRFTRAC